MGQNCSRDHYIPEEFLLISIPEPRRNSTLETLSKCGGVSSATAFTLPEMKVGTLDSLFIVSDNLVRLEKNAECTLKSMLGYESNFEKLQLRNAIELRNSVTHFNWEYAKYPGKHHVKDIVDIIEKQLLRAELDFKKLVTNYTEMKSNLKLLEGNDDDSLAVKDLDEVLRPEDFKLDSDHFKIIPVLVPKISKKDFLDKYATFATMVVPESATLVTEDKVHCLYRVTMFATVVDEFRTKAGEHKFVVRDYDPKSRSVRLALKEKYQNEEAKLQKQLTRWLVTNFKEVFIAYLHIKALRAFVESVLKYGLPLNFKAIVIEPKKGAEKRVRILLDRNFSDLEADDGPIEHNGDAGILATIKNHNLDEYYKYVFMKIVTSFKE